MAFENIKSALYSDELWFGDSKETRGELDSNGEGIYHRDWKYLFVVFLVTAIFCILRILFERYVGAPLGGYNGISDARPKKAPPNRILEQTYKTTKYPRAGKIESLFKITDMSEENITMWFKARRNQDRPSELKKFSESLWKALYYTSMFGFGLYILWDKPWLTDFSQLFENYPRHSVTPSMVWYIRIQIGFYLSLLLTNDTTRSYSVQMTIHHVVTVCLWALAWRFNTVRYAIVMNWMFDISDVFLDCLKTLTYLKKRMIILGVIFQIVWTVTRLIIYPFRMFPAFMELYLSESTTHIAFDVLLIFQMIINILDVYWTYFIYKMVYRTILRAIVEPNREIKDIRSSDEE